MTPLFRFVSGRRPLCHPTSGSSRGMAPRLFVASTGRKVQMQSAGSGHWYLDRGLLPRPAREKGRGMSDARHQTTPRWPHRGARGHLRARLHRDGVAMLRTASLLSKMPLMPTRLRQRCASSWPRAAPGLAVPPICSACSQMSPRRAGGDRHRIDPVAQQPSGAGRPAAACPDVPADARDRDRLQPRGPRRPPDHQDPRDPTTYRQHRQRERWGGGIIWKWLKRSLQCRR